MGVLEHGLPHHRHCIAVALRSRSDDLDGILFNAMNRYGSTVFETAMVHCSEEDKQSICRDLLGRPEYVLQLVKSRFGCLVLKTLLLCPGLHVHPALCVIQGAC